MVELKIKHSKNTEEKGIIQTREYMDLCGAQEGHLVIVDRSPGKTWEQKISTKTITAQEPPIITVWNL